MKKVLIISYLVFIICISFSFNTIFATETDNTLLNDTELTNGILNCAQNALNAYNDVLKNEQSKLDEYEAMLNQYQSSLNNSNTTSLPQTGSSFIVPLLIGFSVFSIIFLTLKIKKYNDIV